MHRSGDPAEGDVDAVGPTPDTDGLNHGDLPAHWFEAIADHVGPAYLRYSFTKGTANEVAFLLEALELRPGMRVLDVGCGPGRHAHALGAAGVEVLGIDISGTFIDLARAHTTAGVSFRRGDARDIGAMDLGEFDAVISLCQGAFGLSGGPASPRNGQPDPDLRVLEGMGSALAPGGRLALSAFSAYFQLRYLEDGDAFDAASGVNHERTIVRDPAGAEVECDLWTTCFTPRELRLLCSAAGLEVTQLWSVTPGRYGRRLPNVDEPEFLVLAQPRR